jgi:ribonuclease PH
MKRYDMRRANELRPMTVIYNIFEYAAGSILYEQGKTKILCAVSLQPSVPPFMRGKGVSWLMAEYALMPASTQTRTVREASVMRRSGRSLEISRLISRALRTVIDDTILGERTITVDCDVLQADGSTRTASITAASAALLMAQNRWIADGTIEKPLLKDGIAAVALGMLANGQLVLDPDYQEDSEGMADMNVIMTYAGKLIEMQGGAEKEPLEWERIEEVRGLALSGLETIIQFFKKHMPPTFEHRISKREQKVPLFSLKMRQQSIAEK